MLQRNVFIAGGTGYIGKRLIAELLSRGHHVRKSEKRKINPHLARYTVLENC